jgi:hypothetical protein
MSNFKQKNQKFIWKNVHTTRIITATIGVLLAIAGFEHGFFETLQGNKTTTGLIIQAIGEANRMWQWGTEEAFTLIPNFLVTGISAMCISIFIVFWSISFVHKKHGRSIFLLLFIILFLVGGGIAQILFFVTAWAYATRINKPLNWWKKILPEGIRNILAKIWIYALIAACISFLVALEIAIFGYFPGQTNPDTIFSICWTFLFSSYFLIHLTFISGFAHDIKRQAGEVA